MATHRLYVAGGYSVGGPTGHLALCETNPSAGPLSPTGTSVPINIEHYFPGEIQKIKILDPNNSKKVFATGDNEIAYWSDDAGTNWTQSIGINGSSQNFLSAEVHENTVWIGGDEGQIYVSTNGGINFTPIQSGFLPTLSGTPISGLVVLDIKSDGVQLIAVVFDIGANETRIYKSTVGINTTTPTWIAMNNGGVLVGKVNDIGIDVSNQYQIIITTPVPADTGVRMSYNGGVSFDLVNPTTEVTVPFGLFVDIGEEVPVIFSFGSGTEINKFVSSGPPLNYVNQRAYNIVTADIFDLIMATNSEGWIALSTGGFNAEVYTTTDGGVTNDTLVCTHSALSINSIAVAPDCIFRVKTCSGCSPYAEYLFAGLPCTSMPGDIYQATPSFVTSCNCWEIMDKVVGQVADDTISSYIKYFDCSTCEASSTNWLLEDCRGQTTDIIIDGNVQDLSQWNLTAIFIENYSSCWTVRVTSDPPTTANIIVVIGISKGGCRSCGLIASVRSWVLRNCSDRQFTMNVQGTGFTVGYVVSLDAFLAGTTYVNCWEVIGTTTSPSDLLANVTDNWASCESCTQGYFSYLVRVCGENEQQIISLSSIVAIGSIITVGTNTYGFLPSDCIEILDTISVSTNDVTSVTGTYVNCEECEEGLPSCFTLESCNPDDYPSIPEVTSSNPVTADLVGNVGSVIHEVDGVDNKCYTVLYNPICNAPVGVTNITPVGPDCVSFSILSTVVVPTTAIGSCNQFIITVVNNSTLDFPFTLSLTGCTDITLLDAATQVIPAGVLATWELEYCPTAITSGACSYKIQGLCNHVVGELCYKSVEITDCTYWNICITEDNINGCKPDCIYPGSIIPITVGGNVTDLTLFPLTITFIVTNKSTGDIVFKNDYVVNDNTELQALSIDVPADVSGKYCATICIPGCDSLKEFCWDVCDPFDVYKDECNKWHLFRPNNCGPQKYFVTVTELDGDVISENVEWDSAVNNYYYFNIPHDGIFIIAMSDYFTGAIIYTFAIFETCLLEKCFKILMDKVMCSCADPCCEKCNGTPEKEVEFARMTLNKLNPLYLTYLGMASKYKVDSIGMKLIPSDTMEFLYSADDVMDKITELLENCDCLCAEENNTKSNTGRCKDCN